MELDVFWSETGKWTSHVIPIRSSSVFERISRTVYWNGILCYLTSAGYLVCIDMNILRSMPDHLKRGACWAFELPDAQQQQEEDTVKRTAQKEVQKFRCIGISCSSLYYSNRDCQRKSTILVWMLVMDKGSCSKWILKHSRNSDEIVGSMPCVKLIENVHQSCWPCAFHPNDDKIIYMAVPDPRFILSYTLRNKNANVIGLPQCPKRMAFEQNLIFPYSRCLVSLTQL